MRSSTWFCAPNRSHTRTNWRGLSRSKCWRKRKKKVQKTSTRAIWSRKRGINSSKTVILTSMASNSFKTIFQSSNSRRAPFQVTCEIKLQLNYRSIFPNDQILSVNCPNSSIRRQTKKKEREIRWFQFVQFCRRTLHGCANMVKSRKFCSVKWEVPYYWYFRDIKTIYLQIPHLQWNAR